MQNEERSAAARLIHDPPEFCTELFGTDTFHCASHVQLKINIIGAEVNQRSRGQISTNTDAITKQAIITANPPLNDPLR